MLIDLHIANFAIIEDETIPFGPGLNVISGETGAGKSIILNALELILGGRARPGTVREGADALELQALFDLSGAHPSIIADLPDLARGDELVLSRTIQVTGKGKAYVNGRLATVGLLEEIASKLISICGQSQHVRLLEPRYHLELVDDYAKHSPLLEEYASLYRAWRARQEELSSLESLLARSVERRAELDYTIAELSASPPRAGLRRELEGAVKRLANGERLLQGIQRVLAGLQEEGGILTPLAGLRTDMADLAKLDEGVTPFVLAVTSAYRELQELSGDLGRYGGSVELDEEGLETYRDQLADLARLERKYKTDDAGLVAILDDARRELSLLLSPVGAATVREEVRRLRDQVDEVAGRLSRSRAEAGRSLARAVKEELAELNMGNASLSLQLEPILPGPTGADRGELLLASNRGESVKPLRQFASGGELSRIMLVLKKLLRDRSGVNVLVFDEVDTGVSGGVARAVGEKLKALSTNSQVVCITHLPQVASLADRHLRVDKIVGERTRSVVTSLSAEERVDEIARMLAGYHITDAARESARELLASNS